MARKPYAEKAVTAVTGRDLDELLRELYVERRHTQDEIAKALDVSRSTVAEWLRERGITRDDRPAVTL